MVAWDLFAGREPKWITAGAFALVGVVLFATGRGRGCGVEGVRDAAKAS